ncbi:MAG: hypothetical protein JXB30_03555 [Anaerolineae bacterium]|nr:hypothetical protein [Anaerolineae bacterium]
MTGEGIEKRGEGLFGQEKPGFSSCKNGSCRYRFRGRDGCSTTKNPEDMDVVGLSILSGAHMALVPRVIELLNDHGMGDVSVLVGGIIPDEDIPILMQLGVRAIFGPGSSMEIIVSFIRDAAAHKRQL